MQVAVAADRESAVAGKSVDRGGRRHYKMVPAEQAVARQVLRLILTVATQYFLLLHHLAVD